MMIPSIIIAIICLYIVVYLQARNFHDHMALHEKDNLDLDNRARLDKAFAEWIARNHEVQDELFQRIKCLEEGVDELEEDCTPGGF